VRGESQFRAERQEQVGAIKVLHFISEPRSWHFFDGQPEYLRDAGFEFYAASSPGDLLQRFGRANSVPVYEVPVKREIAILSDIVSLWRLFMVLRELRPEILHAHFSKPGVIGMLAGFLARTPVRIYHNHGMALSSAQGWKRVLLWSIEKLSCTLAHRVIYVAPSVLNDARRMRVCGSKKGRAVLSANGIDSSRRFTRRHFGAECRDRGRRALQIPAEAFVIGFVGRIFKVKGIDDLVRAWQALAPTEPLLHMLLVGDFDPRAPICSATERAIRSESRIHLAGYVEEPETMYPIMDVLVLPSYHEGLPYSLVEGASMELPVIGTRIPGIVDAMQENVNGILTEPGNPQQLADAILNYMQNPALAAAHGKAGREFAVNHFQRAEVLNCLRHIYEEALDSRVHTDKARLQSRLAGK
jgi:glycosyltransferase involved in cell wall biosynthesis